MALSIERAFHSREEALENGGLWTYGYVADKEFWKHVQNQLIPDFTQYDLELFFFLNYLPNSKEVHNGFPTNVPREEHWWRACAMRWPSKQAEDGRLLGEFERDEWSEEFITAIANNDTVNALGGGGQGKTKTFVAFGITIWDYFAHREMGCRFTISSINEDKVKIPWSYCQSLYERSDTKCSPSICTGTVVPGMRNIKRKGKGLSSQSIVLAVLIPNDSEASTKVDKLTGAHENLCQIILTDEAQNSPEALSSAGKNLQTRAHWFWEFRSGNPNSRDDYLGKAARPVEGWDTVDPYKHPNPPLEWESNFQGKKAWTIRLSNENSPGIKDPIRYHYRPTRAMHDRVYATKQSRLTPEYARFWLGWFVQNVGEQTVLTLSLIEQMGCHLDPKGIDPNREIINFMSFDSAPASLDRSPLGHFQVLYEKGRRIISLSEIYFLPKLNPDTYDRDATSLIIDKATQWHVPSGGLILDNTNRSGPRSLLQERGFMARGLVYSDRPTDKPVDPQTPTKKANDIYTNVITEAAFILEAFIRYGMFRGLNELNIPNIEDEICSRRVIDVNGKTRLEPKHGSMSFRKRMGFSPDVFDILCQAAWFAREYLDIWPGPHVVDKTPDLKNNTPVSKKNNFWRRKLVR